MVSNRPVRPSSTPAKRKGIPLSPLAQQMLQDLQLAGLSDRTHEAYLRAVRKFAQWLKKSPDQASENELRRYLLFIKNDSLKVAYSGLKFFFSHTCPSPRFAVTGGTLSADLRHRCRADAGPRATRQGSQGPPHLLEVNLRQIQKYLGHSSLQSTMLYLHLTTVGEEIAVAKINALMTDRQVADDV
jgi:hypothetical protein